MNAPLPFDGPTYEARDSKRLGRQLKAVKDLMADGKWRTLDQIQGELKVAATTQGISARLRDLRKEKFGGHDVERRKAAPGLYEYRLELRRPAW